MSFHIEQLLLPFVGGTRASTRAAENETPSIFVSVGHTAHSKVNSGIQRVTRSIAKSVLEKVEGADLLEWFAAQERYILLDEVARKKFAQFGGPEHETIQERISREVDGMFDTMSEGGLGKSDLDQAIDYVLSETFLAEFKEGANLADRLNFRIIRRRIRRNLARALSEESSEGADTKESEVESRLVELESCVERVAAMRACSVESLVSEDFRSRILANYLGDEEIGAFEEMVAKIEKSGHRPLSWIAYLPLPQKGRRFVRRRIRSLENARFRKKDRALVACFTRQIVALRKIANRRRNLALDVCLILQMSKDFCSYGSVDEVVPYLRRVGFVKRRLDPRGFLPARGSWVLIPELMTSEEFERVFEFTKGHGLKTAVVFHDALPVQFPELVSERYRSDHERYMRSIAQADLLLPVSVYSERCYKDWARAKDVISPRIEVCLNGADFGVRHEEGAHGSLPEGVGAPYALCVSTIEPRKNHLKLIEAWRSLSAAGVAVPTLVLVGNEYAGFESLAREVAAFCRENACVVWLKGVSDEALEALYGGALFTVFPSLAEGFGLPILESIWFGKPCVCADFGAMAEAAEGGGCLTLDVRETEEIEKGIRSMVTDTDLNSKLEKECRARRLRTWSDYATDVAGLLR